MMLLTCAPYLGLLSLLHLVGADHGNHLENRRSHANHASRDNTLSKRNDGRGTYFVTGEWRVREKNPCPCTFPETASLLGLGACGGWNKPSDYIVALNIGMWDGGSHCGESLTITAEGKTMTATVADEVSQKYICGHAWKE